MMSSLPLRNEFESSTRKNGTVRKMDKDITEGYNHVCIYIYIHVYIYIYIYIYTGVS